MGFFASLVYVTPGGQKVLTLIDYYGGSLCVLALGCVEVIAIGWVYGANRINEDLNFMLDTKLSVYWRFCWGVFIPLILPVILMYNLASGKMPEDLPVAATAVGWTIVVVVVLMFPVYLAVAVIRGKGSLKERFAEVFRSNEMWGPADVQDRLNWVGYLDEEGGSTNNNPFRCCANRETTQEGDEEKQETKM